jgi:hypothetical protein
MSAVAGVTILAFEAVELAVIGFTPLLAFYVGLGLLILVLAVWLRLGDQAIPPLGRREHQPA